jgi:hypothetical protein
MTEWIVAACAVLSLGGAAFSWWRANVSGKARDESKASATRADETLAEIRRQTLALEGLVAAAQPDPLVFEHENGILWRLRNTTDQEIAIERIENAQEFGRAPFDDFLPVVIQPRDAIKVTLLAGWGLPVPATMELQLRGEPGTLRVPIPPSD